MKISITTALQAETIRIGDRVEKYPRHAFNSSTDLSFPGNRSTEYYQVSSIHERSHTISMVMTRETTPVMSLPGAVNRENISPAQLVLDGYWWLS